MKKSNVVEIVPSQTELKFRADKTNASIAEN
jgi:hypothetical protein